jgi:hypothetical protein
MAAIESTDDLYQQMTNIEMNQGIKSLLNNKRGLQAMMITAVLSIVTFTGCSSLDGTAERQQRTKNGLAVYSEWMQEKSRPADSDPDPAYQWSY